MNKSTLPLPNNFDMLSPDVKELVIEYVNQLTEIEQKAYKIAKDHLGSSFNVVKSNGYNDWLKSRK
jgi:hypothetical protein